MKKINKIAIIGVGLIGGSIGLAIKSKRLAKKIVGIGHHRSSINRAIRLKAIDEGTLDLKKGVNGADVVILATPILSMKRIVKKIAPFLKKGCIVTDVGSTKTDIVKNLTEILPAGVFFVGGHPMAGSEKRGVIKARKDLFNNSICILTKEKSTNRSALKLIKGLWSGLGTCVKVLSPHMHDRAVSQISHLPHMIVFSMLGAIEKNSLKLASRGFYDTTRIASSDANIWKDIAISNKKEILKSISQFKKNLSALEKAINKKDSRALMQIFKNAKKKKELG